jgi:hypothetical protein
MNWVIWRRRAAAAARAIKHLRVRVGFPRIASGTAVLRRLPSRAGVCRARPGARTRGADHRRDPGAAGRAGASAAAAAGAECQCTRCGVDLHDLPLAHLHAGMRCF